MKQPFRWVAWGATPGVFARYEISVTKSVAQSAIGESHHNKAATRRALVLGRFCCIHGPEMPWPTPPPPPRPASRSGSTPPSRTPPKPALSFPECNILRPSTPVARSASTRRMAGASRSKAFAKPLQRQQEAESISCAMRCVNRHDPFQIAVGIQSEFQP